MALPNTRRPRAAIEAISSSNVLNNEGDWITVEYKRFMWVTMQPSMKGAHKVPRRHIGSRLHHWKGRILDFMQGKDGKRMAKVQHVYTPALIKIDDNSTRGFPANCKSNYFQLIIVVCDSFSLEYYHICNTILLFIL